MIQISTKEYAEKYYPSKGTLKSKCNMIAHKINSKGHNYKASPKPRFELLPGVVGVSKIDVGGKKVYSLTVDEKYFQR